MLGKCSSVRARAFLKNKFTNLCRRLYGVPTTPQYEVAGNCVLLYVASVTYRTQGLSTIFTRPHSPLVRSAATWDGGMNHCRRIICFFFFLQDSRKAD